MDRATKKKNICAVFVLTLSFSLGVNGYNTYMFDDMKTSFKDPHIVSYTGARVRREAPAAPQAESKPATNASAAATAITTANLTNPASVPNVGVTQIPLLGRNGTGIHRDQPQVSDPILPDENITALTASVMTNEEDVQKLGTEHNITKSVEDGHDFYNSTFIANKTLFDEHWANISKRNPDVHQVLSNSHRRATTLRLSFDFPFYGHPLRNITVATGGFIYTGEHVHNWLAATQYIAPLMANFDTTLTEDSYVKMVDDGEKFTVFWENVTLQEDKNKTFTFAVTLQNNGDIVFAYKNVPIAVENISDADHPVKVGISDAYLHDKILFLVRRKTIYEYHRVSFKNYEISNNTILKLTALPTCLQYNSCDACLNHDTGFDCMWCEAIRKCSSGTDRNKQDWVLRSCDRTQVSNLTQCGGNSPPAAAEEGANTVYTTDTLNNTHTEAVINTMTSKPEGTRGGAGGPAAGGPAAGGEVAVSASSRGEAAPARSAVGGVVAALAVVTLVAAAAAWTLYAFKNPHTRSGQFLIKYRPSQWSWRRGEARYTAATIHM